MDAQDPPSAADIDSQFETLRPPTDGAEGEPLFRGTHRYEQVTVERTYHVEDSVLSVETGYLDGGEFVATTGEPVDAFCRRTHLLEPEADVRYCARVGVGPSDADGPGGV